MLFLVPFMLLFAILGLLWIAGAAMFFGVVLSSVPKALGTALDYKGGPCACHFPFRHHD